MTTSSHINLREIKKPLAEIEKQINAEKTLVYGRDYFGPDTTANLRNREVNRKTTDELCDRIAAAAQKAGRPLTTEEITMVGELLELDRRVAALEKQP